MNEELCSNQIILYLYLPLNYIYFGDGKEWLWGEWRRPLLVLIYFF